MTRCAEDLGLPTGDAVLRDGQVMIINPNRKPAEISRMPPQEIGAWSPSAGAQVVPASTSHTEGSHQDRARAFVIRTKYVSLAFGGVSGIVAVVGFGVPLLSLPILLWIFGAYAAVWFASFAWDTAATPDGISLIKTLHEAGEIRAERKERHSYYRSQYKNE